MNLRQNAVAILLILFSLSMQAHDLRSPELIQPLRLTAGQTDTLLISDIFFAESYPLRFAEHPDLKTAFDAATLQLVITPAATFEGMTILEAQLDDSLIAFPVIVSQQITHTFRFRAANQPKHLSVFGAFNAWNRDELRLRDANGDGEYEITIPIEPGRYEYKFFVDGAEILDRANPDSIANPFGSYNSVLTIRPRHTDQAYVHILGKSIDADTATVSLYYERNNQPGAIAASNVIALLDNQPLPQWLIKISGNDIDVCIPQTPQTVHQTLRVGVTQNGQSTLLQTIRLYHLQPYASYLPFYWNDAIIYSVMVDRFFDDDSSNNRPVEHPELLPPANFMGGDLRGIIQKIRYGYFDSLGVNTLWISPVNQNTTEAHREYPPPHRYYSAYHGYWPVEPKQVDSRFGDMAMFKKLVRTAHLHGMRILLDFVSNHTHQDHPFFRDHRDWFGTYDLPDGRKNMRLWDEYRLTTWFEPFLPSFDYLGSDAALETMTDNAVWWLQETGIDGFRQDAVKHVPNKFWRTLTRKIKSQVHPQRTRSVFQIGETFGGYDLISSYVNHGQLDSQFNFNLFYTARQVFLTPQANFQNLVDELAKTHAVYGMSHRMGNLMDSHDQTRYMAFVNGDLALDSQDAAEVAWIDPPQVDDSLSYRKARLYLAYMLTIPGIPTIYYGDEIGMTGASDPDNRRMMRFGSQLNQHEKEMLANTRELVNFRRRSSALRQGDFLPLFADQNVLAYMRSDVSQRILVLLNKSDAPKTQLVQLPETYGVSEAVDLFSRGAAPVANSRLSVDIPAFGYRMFLLR